MKERFENICEIIGVIFVIMGVLLLSLPLPLCLSVPALIPVAPILLLVGLALGALGIVLICQ